MKPSAALALLLTAALAACAPLRRDPPPAGPPEARSLLGQPLYAPELPLETRQRLEAQLAEAKAAYDRDPEDAEALIWYGRRMAYLGRYRQAIEIFTEGVRRHPRDARMYRHRGHRWITVREFGNAVRDLEAAARLTAGQPDQVEPDGMPNARNLPLTTLQGNIHYHLGLAHYLRGDFRRAARAFRESLARAGNDDGIVASSDWLYMALRRMGRDAEARAVLAPIRPDMDIVENRAYHRRLLLYQGALPPDSLLADRTDAVQIATQGYGVANWYYYNGQRDRAEELLWQVTAAENWAPFGYIAAEADLRRLQRGRR